MTSEKFSFTENEHKEISAIFGFQTNYFSDSSLLSLSQCSVVQSFSYKRHIEFLRYCILPIIANLNQPASRNLFTAIIHIAHIRPRVTLFELLIPLIIENDCGKISPPQFEIIFQITNECLCKNLQTELFLILTCGYENYDIIWNNDIVQFIHSLIKSGIYLDCQLSSIFCDLLQMLTEKSDFQTSLPFSMLILTFISKYSNEILPFKHILLDISSMLNSPVKHLIKQKLESLNNKF